MHCLYAPDLDNDTHFILSEGESHHLANVLRVQNGETIKLTNGRGKLFEVIVTNNHKKHSQVEVVKLTEFSRQKGAIHIALAPVKTNERLGFVLEKLTELNVAGIYPIRTQNSERKVFNRDKELHHLIAAIKQSQNPFLPELHEMIRFYDLFSGVNQNVAQKLIGHCRDMPKQLLSRQYKAGNDVLICIGPEGDFTKEEIAMATDKGFEAVTLGEEVLRAETAAITAAIMVKTINQLQ